MKRRNAEALVPLHCLGSVSRRAIRTVDASRVRTLPRLEKAPSDWER